MAAGDEVERPHLRGQGPTVRPEIGTEAVQCGGRCHAVGTHEDGWYGCDPCDPLPGRFSVVRSSGLPSVKKALDTCVSLGVPVAPKKTEGPSTKLVFLGIELDTVSLTLSLPQEKLERLRREIRKWVCRKCCTKRELLSIIGQLQHACSMVKLGRSFLRRMIDLS